MRLAKLGMTATVLSVVHLASHCAQANSNDFRNAGTVYFTNLTTATAPGALIPYVGYANSPQLGFNIQTGSIRNLSGLIAAGPNRFIFYGEVGPHPWMPRHPRVHLIETGSGNIFCSWTAVFTLEIISPNGDAVFSGDGSFLANGGTDRYRKASGSFRTLFRSGPVPPGSNDAEAWVTQWGTIKK